MPECFDKDTKDFLLTLLDMIQDVGPEGVKEICARGDSECEIDQGRFDSQITKARNIIEGLGCEG